MLEILLRPAVLGPALLIVGYVVYKTLFASPKLPDLPIIGAKKGDIFPIFQARWRNTLNYKAAVTEAYDKHKHEAVLVPMTGPGVQVLLPVSETQWVVDQPDNVLNMHAEATESLQTDYTVTDPALIKNPTHHKLITTTLTNQIGNLVPDVADECEWSFAKHWKEDTENWTEVGVYESLRHIIGGVTNRVFVGLPYCRDPKLVEAGMAFAQDIPLSSMVLRAFPPAIRPLVAPLITIPNVLHTRRFLNIIRPEVERRLAEYDQRQQDPEKNNGGDGPGPAVKNDYLQWTLKQAKESGDPYMYRWDTIAGRVLLLNFAAIHTTSFTATSTIIDLAYGSKDDVEEIRREVEEALAAHGGQWTKQALARMEKLDSALRESTRLSSIVTVGLSRRVVKPGGVTTPSGVHIPEGTQVVVHAYPVFRDPAHYEAPDEFRPFRFAERRHEEGAEYVRRARNAFPTTSNEFLAFGHGRNACPGRFFAANEVKLLLGYMLLHYDFEPVQQPRPTDKWMGMVRVPPLKATIRIRRRKME